MPLNAVVITGASGFVGQKLVRALGFAGRDVVGIARSPAPRGLPATARWVQADLNQPETYAEALQGADCVIHLAAVTGKARPEAYRIGNIEATRALLAASEKAGVKRLVMVSSIAARFADRSFYPYADSKIAAEELVRKSPLSTAIVRPTMILGPGSPIQGSLELLARLPVTPLFGNGLRRVEPVEADDVVKFLVGLATESWEPGVEIDLGGPATYTLRDLLAKLRAVQGISGAPKFLAVPLVPVRAMLAAVEGPLLPLLPLTAGQLATFANDSVAEPSPLVDRLLPVRRASPSGPARAEPVTTTGSIDDDPPSGGAVDEPELKTEFERAARHLSRTAVTDYQTAKYLEFHRQRGAVPRDDFDAMLLRLSQAGPLGLALADAYCGLLYRKSVVRKKLVVAAAILETSPPSFKALDAPRPGGALSTFTGLVAAGFTLAAAMFPLLPAHIWFAANGRLAR